MAEETKFKTQEERIIDSPNFLIFVQGAWQVWNNNNNIAASNVVTDNGLASVLLYDSKRDWKSLANLSSNEQWIAAFDEKTYQDELAELREKIDYVITTYKPENLFLSGYSYGGGLAAIVS